MSLCHQPWEGAKGTNLPQVRSWRRHLVIHILHTSWPHRLTCPVRDARSEPQVMFLSSAVVACATCARGAISGTCSPTLTVCSLTAIRFVTTGMLGLPRSTAAFLPPSPPVSVRSRARKSLCHSNLPAVSQYHQPRHVGNGSSVPTADHRRETERGNMISGLGTGRTTMRLGRGSRTPKQRCTIRNVDRGVLLCFDRLDLICGSNL